MKFNGISYLLFIGALTETLSWFRKVAETNESNAAFYWFKKMLTKARRKGIYAVNNTFR